jgi:hypothetical protein
MRISCVQPAPLLRVLMPLGPHQSPRPQLHRGMLPAEVMMQSNAPQHFGHLDLPPFTKSEIACSITDYSAPVSVPPADPRLLPRADLQWPRPGFIFGCRNASANNEPDWWQACAGEDCHRYPAQAARPRGIAWPPSLNRGSSRPHCRTACVGSRFTISGWRGLTKPVRSNWSASANSSRATAS